MGWKSKPTRYGAVAMAMHWLTAAAIFGLIGSGLVMDNSTDDATRTMLLRGHAIAGFFVVALTLLRIGWWAFADRRPARPAGMPRWQALAAMIVHRLFYVVILAMGASGIAMIALSGAGTILFGGATGPLPDFENFAPRAPHGFGAWAMIALVVVHIGAALYHQFVSRDRLLARMGVGSVN